MIIIQMIKNHQIILQYKMIISHNKLPDKLINKLKSIPDIELKEDDISAFSHIIIYYNVEPQHIFTMKKFSTMWEKHLTPVIVILDEDISLLTLSKYYESGATCVCNSSTSMDIIINSIKSIYASTLYNHYYSKTTYELSKYTTFIPGKNTMISGEVQYHLNPKEVKIFKILCDNIGKHIPKKTFLYTIWGNTSHSSDRSFDVYINRLRHLLENDENIDLRKIRGTGYMLYGGDTNKKIKNKY